MKTGCIPIYSDVLVCRFWDKGRIYSQGKRVSREVRELITDEERRLYVKYGIVPCLREIRRRLTCSLDEARTVLNLARGEQVRRIRQ